MAFSLASSGPTPAIHSTASGIRVRALKVTSWALASCSRPMESSRGTSRGVSRLARSTGAASGGAAAKLGMHRTRPAGQPWATIQSAMSSVLATSSSKPA